MRRLPHAEARTFLQTLRREGWELVGRSGSGHLLLAHPAVKQQLSIAATPGRHKATRVHELARARRMVRQATGGNW